MSFYTSAIGVPYPTNVTTAQAYVRCCLLEMHKMGMTPVIVSWLTDEEDVVKSYIKESGQLMLFTDLGFDDGMLQAQMFAEDLGLPIVAVTCEGWEKKDSPVVCATCNKAMPEHVLRFPKTAYVPGARHWLNLNDGHVLCPSCALGGEGMELRKTLTELAYAMFGDLPRRLSAAGIDKEILAEHLGMTQHRLVDIVTGKEPRLESLLRVDAELVHWERVAKSQP